MDGVSIYAVPPALNTRKASLRAKTGSMNRVRSYAGYVKTKTGKDLAFSIIVNNYNCRSARMKKKIEKVLVVMAGM